MMIILQKVFEKFSQNFSTIAIATMLFVLSEIYFFRKSKRIASAGLLLLGICSILYVDVITEWLNGLGGDSYLELSNFDIKEAAFWVCSFASILSSINFETKVVTFIVIASSVASIALYAISKKRPSLVNAYKFVLLLCVTQIVISTIAGYVKSRNYVSELNNTFINSSSKFKKTDDIDLFVYVGESTSSLNMSLYGYPIRTTPHLDSLEKTDERFVAFNGVRSTHTHTTFSLLDAFSTEESTAHGEKRIGIGNILKSAGIDAYLYSAQPLHGSFATFSKYVYSGTLHSTENDDRYKGNYISQKYKDSFLLGPALNKSGVVIFHSYAGHGGYLDHIDLTKSEPVAHPKIGFHGIFGSKFSETFQAGILDNVFDYDRAIKYIDLNLFRSIENIRARNKPSALIYFSDHGESVYTRRGHESSRYIDEMSTVPFIVYFNQAYVDKYPDVYARFKHASSIATVKLLDQVTPTIIDLLRLRTTQENLLPSIGSPYGHPNPIILKRDTSVGRSSINLNPKNGILPPKDYFIGGTPEPTYSSIVNATGGLSSSRCYHRSNTYAKALRGASVTNCIEVDLVVDNAGTLSIHHPPTPSTGLTLEHIFSIAEHRKTNIWIDGKNIDNPKACMWLYSYIEKNRQRVGKILVEFPSTSVSNLSAVADCANKIRSLGAKASFYLPTETAISCAKDTNGNSGECQSLHNIIRTVSNSGIFSDFSFDYGAYEAVRRFSESSKLRWNTWQIPVWKMKDVTDPKFDFVIEDTSFDPNTY